MAHGPSQKTLVEWVRERAPLLAAVGMLFLCVAVLILVEVLRGL